MWKRLVFLTVFLSGLLGAEFAASTTFEARDFNALVSEADQIVIGTVAAKNARRTGEREIVTDFRFDDVKVVKGAVPLASVTLTMLGGTVGTETLAVAGAPTFNVGVRYLVFVSGNGSVMFPVVGGHQGIFQLRKDGASGVSRVHDHAGRPALKLPGLPGRAPGADADLAVVSGEALTETAFVDAIRGKLAERGAP